MLWSLDPYYPKRNIGRPRELPGGSKTQGHRGRLTTEALVNSVSALVPIWWRTACGANEIRICHVEFSFRSISTGFHCYFIFTEAVADLLKPQLTQCATAIKRQATLTCLFQSLNDRMIEFSAAPQSSLPLRTQFVVPLLHPSTWCHPHSEKWIRDRQCRRHHLSSSSTQTLQKR